MRGVTKEYGCCIYCKKPFRQLPTFLRHFIVCLRYEGSINYKKPKELKRC